MGIWGDLVPDMKYKKMITMLIKRTKSILFRIAHPDFLTILPYSLLL